MANKIKVIICEPGEKAKVEEVNNELILLGSNAILKQKKGKNK